MSIYEEIEIEDMKFDPETGIFTYSCPCGDKFNIHLDELLDGEDIADCPSCTLRIRVIFEEEDLSKYVITGKVSELECNDQSDSLPESFKPQQSLETSLIDSVTTQLSSVALETASN